MSIERVKAYFKQEGIEDRMLVFEQSTATTEMAAEFIGCEPSRICKTMAFKSPEEDGCILVQMAGDAKVSNGKVKSEFGLRPTMLPKEDLTRLTGHDFGGICAFAIDNPNVRIYGDVSLKRFETVFPACGSDSSAIEMTLEELSRYSKMEKWVDVCKD